MIQRIQSVYLLLGTLLLALFVGLGNEWVNAATSLHASVPWVVYVLATITGLVSFVALLLYKDRARQAQAISYAQWLSLALILVVVAAMGMLSFGSQEGVLPSSLTAYLKLLMPVAAYVFFSLARRAVQKDIALLRSVDRLR